MSAGKIWVAGHRGMVGSAVARQLGKRGDDVLKADRKELDLRNQTAVETWLQHNRPDAIVIAAAKVGGIYANDTFPAEFLYENLAIETNIIHAAHGAGIDRVVFLGSSCIYPKFAPQPIKEESLLTGPLEPTNEWYAIAKIAGIKLCQAYRKQYGRRYISVMPCNLYGPGDNFDALNSHVLPALIRRFHEAKAAELAEVVCGAPARRCANCSTSTTWRGRWCFAWTITTRTSTSIAARAAILRSPGLPRLVARVVGYRGKIAFDPSKPDGTPRKLLDSSRIAALGWKPEIALEDGIAATYRWYLENKAAGKTLAA